MLKLMLTVCLFTFAAYLPANEQEEISSQEIIQEALSCNCNSKNDEPKDAAKDALTCLSQPESDEDKADVTEESSPLALFCPDCTEIEPDFLACKGKK